MVAVDPSTYLELAKASPSRPCGSWLPTSKLKRAARQAHSVGALYAGKPPQQIQRGVATVPLVGVDLPLHSSLLRLRMNAFRRMLQESLNLDRVSPQRVVGKYIPNMTGSPLSSSKKHFEPAYDVTKSETLKDVLNN